MVKAGIKKNPDETASVRSANSNDAAAAVGAEKVADLEEEDEEKEVTESAATVNSGDEISASCCEDLSDASVAD